MYGVFRGMGWLPNRVILGGAMILGAMSASASYIAAPAAVRVLQQAQPSYYLTTSLGIRFPFNILVGVPVYYTWARFLYDFLGGTL